METVIGFRLLYFFIIIGNEKAIEIHPTKSRYVYMNHRLSATRSNQKLRFGCLSAVVLGLGGAALLCGNPRGKEQDYTETHATSGTKTKDTGHVGKKKAHVTRRNVDTSTSDNDMPEMIEGQAGIDRMTDLINQDCNWKQAMNTSSYVMQRALIGRNGNVFAYLSQSSGGTYLLDSHHATLGHTTNFVADSDSDTEWSDVVAESSATPLFMLEQDDMHDDHSSDDHVYAQGVRIIDNNGDIMATIDFDHLYLFDEGTIVQVPIDFPEQVVSSGATQENCDTPFEYHAKQ